MRFSLFKSNFKSIVLIIVISGVLQILYSYNIDILVYNRDIFFKKIYIQFLTPSLVHFNFMHWFLNILNLIALGIIFNKEYSNKSFLIIFIFLSIFTLLLLYFFNQNIKYYVGMSGVLYGVAVYLILKSFYNKREVFVASIILIYLLSKIFFGEYVNEFMGVDRLLKDLNIIRDMHFYGALGGVLVFVIEYLFIKKWGEAPR